MNTRVIIPVCDEVESVPLLVSEFGELRIPLHIDFIDDSRSLDTVAAIEQVRDDFPWLTISYFHREGDDHSGGIIGAVKAGLARAKADGNRRIVAMDGDGQHAPTDIPRLIEKLDRCDLAPSSRYIPGGSREGFDGMFRMLGSFAATRMAKALFPRELKDVTDPMTGFFAANLDRIDIDAIDGSGFKVLLEILLTTPGLTISEVPVRFRDRLGGMSKANTTIAVEYATQLLRRRLATPNRFFIRREMQFENV